MSNSSKVADHCIPYSLSETGCQGDYRKLCDHAHDECCNQRKVVAAALNDITEKVKQATYPSVDDHDEAVYLL